jgi:hypothetical protein
MRPDRSPVGDILVTVGGLNTRVSASVDEMVREAETQRAEAGKLRANAKMADPNAVASIAYLGYDAPQGLASVSHDYLAQAAAGPLNNFYKGLAATTNVPNQHITAFGHSYGSLVTSLALQKGAPVSDGALHERAYGHSEYARDGSNGQLRMSGYNLAAVLAGVPAEDHYLVPQQPPPPPVLPPGLSAPGPLGIPVPNPAYPS